MEELQNLTPLYNKEFYLAYLCGEDVELPIPDGNAERYLAYLCGMDVTIPDVPDGRTETYLAYKCGEDVVLPDPLYRIEFYLAKWCGMDVEVPEPMYRIEYWLAQLANSGELKTVSGNPISVSDALARPAESLVIEILPQQSGSGDPSPDNVRPISGFTGCNVTKTGKNLFETTLESQTKNHLTFTVNEGGSVSVSGTASALTILELGRITLQAGSYFIMGCPQGGSASTYRMYLSTGNNEIGNGISKTLTEETTLILQIAIASGTTLNDTYRPMVCFGSTATAYEPYQGTTYSISWQDEAGTVYGGSLDVTSGVLTAVPYYGSYNGEPLVGPWVSSMDKYVAGTTPTIGAQVVDMGGTGTDIQLSATDVELLEGNNTIWNDVGDMTLEYLADGPAEDIDALQILLGNRYVNNGGADEATDREALDILLGGNTR